MPTAGPAFAGRIRPRTCCTTRCKSILGKHAQQQGSKVDDDWLRFDFANPSAVDRETLGENRRRSERARAGRRAGRLGRNCRSPRPGKAGAMMLFGEKYPDIVRMVSMGEFSKELCGGTHVDSTGQIGLFRITQRRKRLGRHAADRRAHRPGGAGNRRAKINMLGRNRGGAARAGRRSAASRGGAGQGNSRSEKTIGGRSESRRRDGGKADRRCRENRRRHRHHRRNARRRSRRHARADRSGAPQNQPRGDSAWPAARKTK